MNKSNLRLHPSSFVPRRRRLWFLLVAVALLMVAAGYICIPRRSDTGGRICIQNQNWDTLKEVSLTISDSSRQKLTEAKLELSVSYDQNNRAELCGIEGWDSDMTEKILKASNDGLLVSIGSRLCKQQEFKLSRSEIRSFYELPYLKTGGHGSGFHVASMHYRFSHNLDLDCELATKVGP